MHPTAYCIFLTRAYSDRDIGLFASWSVSSSKPGFEVEQLVDPTTSTFWQWASTCASKNAAAYSSLHPGAKDRSRIT